jgi:hypothetical protein
MKELIIKSNNWLDKVKEPFRFILVMIGIGLPSLLITTNPSEENYLLIAILYFLVMFLITIWRLLGFYLRK